MAYEENGGGNGMIMPVAPFYGGNGNGSNGFGGDWAWIILLLLLGWGNNGFGGGGMGGGGLYPWLNNSNQINDGFMNQMLNGNLNGIQNAVTGGFGDIQTALCGGFAGVNATVNGAQNALAQQLYGLQSALSQCCCDNRLATVQTQNVVQNEGAQTRLAIQNQTQQIIDKMCQQEIDALKERNSTLKTDLLMRDLAASQTAQTAQLERSNGDVIEGLYNRLVQCPIPSQPVYGSQAIFSCPNNNGGCGCGA